MRTSTLILALSSSKREDVALPGGGIVVRRRAMYGSCALLVMLLGLAKCVVFFASCLFFSLRRRCLE